MSVFRNLQAVSAVALLAMCAALPAQAQTQQVPRREGNVSDWRHWQPTPAQVRPQEKQEGVALSTPQRKAVDRHLARIDRTLLKRSGANPSSASALAPR